MEEGGSKKEEGGCFTRNKSWKGEVGELKSAIWVVEWGREHTVVVESLQKLNEALRFIKICQNELEKLNNTEILLFI